MHVCQPLAVFDEEKKKYFEPENYLMHGNMYFSIACYI